MKELTRIPKSFSTDFKNLQGTYGELAPIVRDILIYLSNKKMNDLFGDNTFTLDDFCYTVGRSKKELQRKVKDEYRKIILGGADGIYRNSTGEHLLENSFELALWIATNRNLMLTRKKTNGVFETIGIQLITKFEIGADFSTLKSQKRSYLVNLSNSIKDLLLSNYNLIELKDYRSIPSIDGWRDFYLFLARIIVNYKFKTEKKEDPKFIMSIDELCDIFGTSFSNNDDKKKYVRKTLNKIQSSLEAATFQYEFITNGNRYKYHVEFYFDKNVIEYFDEKVKREFLKKLLQEFQNEFINEYFHTLPFSQRFVEFKKMMDNFNTQEDVKNTRKEFYDWLFSEKNIEHKMSKYKEIFFQIYKVPYNETKGFNI
jgi:hypothetical protein